MEEYDRQDALFYDHYSTGVPGDVVMVVRSSSLALLPPQTARMKT